MSRKEEIIQTALKLFNEQGTKAVTTNHIAAEMGISAGNLYYYFRNKEEIIREIFIMMDSVGMEEYGRILQKYPVGSLAAIEQTFTMIQNFNWRFRFFKRELTSLFVNDTFLHEQYAKVHKNMLDVVRTTVKGSISEGIFHPMDEEQLSLFAEEIWVITLFWLNYLEAGKEEVTEETLSRGNKVLRSLLFSRLTEEGKKQISS